VNFRLLALRAAPLLIRPLAILLEGWLVPDQFVIVLVLPIAMMAHTMSSIPVHLEYFQSRSADARIQGQAYASALGLVLAVVVPLLALILWLADAFAGAILIAATCLMYLIEKLSEESSRMLEFRKAFGGWFLVQVLRSAWLLVPIALFLLGATYEIAFLMTAAVFVCVAIGAFVRVTRLVPWPNLSAAPLVRKNIIFLASSFLPASYRQIPRIMITRLFPNQAHIYLAIAQAAQAAGLMFNVRFQIPYRKAIARKTAMVQRRRHPAMMRFAAVPFIVAPVWMAASFVVSLETMSDLVLAVFLTPLLLADALVFAIIAAHLDYLHWLRHRARLLMTYMTNAALLGVLLGILLSPGAEEHLSVVLVASAFTMLGLAWISVVLRYNFPSKHGGEGAA